jgi:hypothetical protein
VKLGIREALIEANRDRWQCLTCSGVVEEGSVHCRHCAAYWEDCRNGLWSDLDDRRALSDAAEGGQ